MLLTFLTSFIMTGSGQLLGGYKKHENHHNDARVQEIAAFAVEEISKKENEKLDLVKVVSVSSQVVAGKNYKLVLDLATPAQKLQAYEVTVYEPLGGQDMQLTEHKPVDKAKAAEAHEQSTERHSGALLGGYKEVEPADDEVTEAAEFATKQLNEQSNSLLPFELKEVLQARTKVTNGKVFELKLSLAQGKQADKVYQVEVARSLQNQFTIQSSKSV